MITLESAKANHADWQQTIKDAIYHKDWKQYDFAIIVATAWSSIIRALEYENNMITTIIGYKYEADMHCQECAEKRFGMKLYGNVPIKDNEDNDVHPMYSHEEHGTYGDDCTSNCDSTCEHYLPAYCGDCLGELS